MRRPLAFALAALSALGAIFGLALALSTLSTMPAAAAPGGAGTGCSPSISGYTRFQVSDKGADPSFSVFGKCLGTSAPLTATTTPYFRVVDFSPQTKLSFAEGVIRSDGASSNAFTNPLSPKTADTRWNGCSSLVDGVNGGAPNQVTCTISKWTSTEITLSSYAGLYGQGYQVSYGDLLVVQVWDPQTGAGPADLYLRAGYPGSMHVAGGHAASSGAGGGGNPEVSSIGRSLPKVGHAFSNVSSDVVDAVIALALALFITFPANLFNSTFEENYADIVAWWRKWTAIFFPEPVRKSAKSAYNRATGWILARARLAGRSEKKEFEREKVTFWGVLLAGALLGTMLDPAVGFNTRTVLSYIAIVIAMVFGVAISGFITWGYHRGAKHGNVPYKLEALPVGLLVAAVCVVISRASGFTPGYLYGVICGVSFARKLAKHEEGHLVAISSVLKVVLAIAAWVAWDTVTDHASHSGSFFGTVLLDDFLASLFVSSLVGTLISLFPLRFLPGHKLQAWHKGAWLAVFGLTLFVLVQVLLRPHSTSSGPSHTPLVSTAVLFVLFGAGSLVFREHFARKQRRRQAVAAPVEGGVIELEVAEGPAQGMAPAQSTGPQGPAPAG